MDPRASSITSSPLLASQGYKNCVYFTNTSTHEKDFHPRDIPVDNLTHVFYAYFEPNELGVVSSIDKYADFEKRYPGDSVDGDSKSESYGCIKQFALLKKQHRHLKLILTIGGPSSHVTANFAAISGSPAGRANFVDTSLATLKDCGFDGLNIHWEWPANKTEAANYPILLSDLRHALDNHASSQPNRPHFSLSVACPASPAQYTLLDLHAMDRHLTFWNLLTHDSAAAASTTTSSSITAHQSNVFTAPSNTAATPHNPAQAISDLLASDIDPAKILLGCPLYGRGFANTSGLGHAFHGTPAADTGCDDGVRAYKNLPASGDGVELDSAANAAYSYDGERRELFSYDNPDSVGMKARFIESQGLGGALFWEASGDRGGEGALTGVMARCLGGEDFKGLDRSENTVVYAGR